MTKTVTIDLPDEIYQMLGKNAEKQLKLLLAIKLWEDGLISFEKASEISG